MKAIIKPGFDMRKWSVSEVAQGRRRGGLDERAMAALFEMSLRDFHAAGAGAVA